MRHFKATLFAIVLLCAAAILAPAQACGNVEHAAKATVSARAAAAAVTFAAADRHRDRGGQHPCDGHGCCQVLGAACSTACANGGIVVDDLQGLAPCRLTVADAEMSSRTVGIVIDPEIDPPRSLALI